MQQQACAVALDIHAWTLFTDHFSDARISRISLSTFMWQLSRLTVNKCPASLRLLGVQKFQGGGGGGGCTAGKPSGYFAVGGATYTRVYCMGVPQSEEAVTPV